MVSVRESVILTFDTAKNRLRSLSVPNPLPAGALTEAVVRGAAGNFVLSDVFDEASEAGSLASLNGAVRERVTTTVLV